MRRAWWSLAVIVGMTAACESAEPPPIPDSELGTLEASGRLAEVQIPDSAVVGEEFAIAVDQLAGACDQIANPRVVPSADGADVYLRVVRASAGPGQASAACPDTFISASQSVTLRFDRLGEHVVRIHGWSADAESAIDLESTVVVAPPDSR